MTAPPPLVPANVDLRSMPEMPLDVALFRDASIIDSITEQSLKAAIILWCVSWHQVPAGSLPDDDNALARWTGFGKHVSEWREIRDQALWKFVKCSDGRLYHPVICAKAIRTWEYRQSYRNRMAAAREAKAEKNQKPIPGPGRPMTRSMIEPIAGSMRSLNQTKPNQTVCSGAEGTIARARAASQARNSQTLLSPETLKLMLQK